MNNWPFTLLDRARLIYHGGVHRRIRAEAVEVRGTIAAFDGKSLSVKDADGRAVDVEMTDKAELIFNKPMPLSDVKSGDFGAGYVRSRGWEPDRVTRRAVRQAGEPGPQAVPGTSDQTMMKCFDFGDGPVVNGRELMLSHARVVPRRSSSWKRRAQPRRFL